jgi:hypothetical protein
MDYYNYRTVMIGCSIGLFFLELCILISLSKRLLAELIERAFEITRLDHQTLMMNFFGIQINLESSRRFRLSLIFQLAGIASINLLLLMDGCIMQVHHLSGRDLCPPVLSDCFKVEIFPTHERIVCQPGQLLSNSTFSNVVCFVWVYREQNTLNILNQLGICSSVFSLLCHTFKCSCRMSRKWWGLSLLVLFVLIFVTLLIITPIIKIPISTASRLLLTSASFLIINVIQLLQFTHNYKSQYFLTSTK